MRRLGFEGDPFELCVDGGWVVAGLLIAVLLYCIASPP